MPNEAPSNKIEIPYTAIIRYSLDFNGNPTLVHLIYQGGGACFTFKLGIGNGFL